MKNFLVTLGLTVWCSCFVYGLVSFTSDFTAKENLAQQKIVKTISLS